MDFRTYVLFQWTAFLVIGGVLILVVAFISIGAIVGVILLFVVLAGVVYWGQGRMQDQLDRHDSSIPMPGLLGLLGVDLNDDGDSSDDPPPEASVVRDAPPTCPECGFQSSLGDLTCSRCGTPLWGRPSSSRVEPPLSSS